MPSATSDSPAKKRKNTSSTVQSDCYTQGAQLDISRAPDTLLRVFMAWKPLEEKVDIPAQTLTAPARDGFTAVEWGGSRIN